MQILTQKDVGILVLCKQGGVGAVPGCRCSLYLIYWYKSTNSDAAGDAVAVLDELRQGGWKVGVLSNFDSRLTELLDHLKIASKLDWVLLPRDTGVLKPSRAAFMAALEAASASPTAVCVHVGDSLNADIRGAAQVRNLHQNKNALVNMMTTKIMRTIHDLFFLT